MRVLEETVFMPEALVRIELTDKLEFRLAFGDLVEYVNGSRRVLGRSHPYEFRSVEQLRYDFERDVIAAGGKLGEAA
jgi:hypothetical protein